MPWRRGTQKRMYCGNLPAGKRDQSDKDLKAVVLSLISSLKSCAKKKDLFQGSTLHADIRNRGLLDKSTPLGNTLISMYAKCGALAKAIEVLDEMSVHDVVSWNALIAGYAQQSQGEEALLCYEQMRSEGLSPDAFTYACILKACAITRDYEMGRNVHDEISSIGLLEHDVVLGNAVVDMYIKCGALRKAQEVLFDLPLRNVVTWSTLITGFIQHEQSEETMKCFRRMLSEGVTPNAFTYACILKACGITQDIGRGKEIHDEVVNQGLLEKDIILGNALIDMYVKCGELTVAERVLEKLPVRDVISWSAMIAGYARQGQGEEALGCFRQMQREGLSPNAVTYAGILRACGIILESEMGEQIHDEIVHQGLLEGDLMLGTALVEMYAKCGTLTKAQKAFDDLIVWDLATWNALISGYAQQGQGVEVLNCFERMQIEGLSPDIVSWNTLIGACAQQGLAQEALFCFHEMQEEGTCPNAITFINVLNACSHSGLVDEGQMYFETMIKKYGITPDKEHQTCMVDLFGRARHFDKTLSVIEKMPFSDYPPVWSALLSACREWGNVKLGRIAFDHAVQLDGGKIGPYILMENIYAAAGMEEDVHVVESLRVKIAASGFGASMTGLG
ncbi:hypothetical protein GOP47_0012085 [Adiantum capillus-veneris]|uniref:Pentatricopeptide repeat-containing protein n=1 Tax=Adiantum capillus-veneris TaxID=13818 RepID=A0A9D4UUD7_ADICA|nr:hypothetical protein GOP47_0012085 [Adiantum capillus-veneris]